MWQGPRRPPCHQLHTRKFTDLLSPEQKAVGYCLQINICSVVYIQICWPNATDCPPSRSYYHASRLDVLQQQPCACASQARRPCHALKPVHTGLHACACSDTCGPDVTSTAADMIIMASLHRGCGGEYAPSTSCSATVIVAAHGSWH